MILNNFHETFMGVARTHCAYDEVSLLKIIQSLRSDVGSQMSSPHGVPYPSFRVKSKGLE